MQRDPLEDPHTKTTPFEAPLSAQVVLVATWALFIGERMANAQIDYSIKVDTVDLDRYLREIEPEVERVVLVAGFHVETRSKQIAIQKGVFDTGALVNSIHLFQSAFNRMEARIGPTVEYAAINEFGGHGRPGRPYMVPALEQERGPFVQALTQVLDG